MNRGYKSAVLICLVILLVGIPVLNAQWVENGIPICTASEEQDYLQIIADGAGGAIIVWEDYRSLSDSDVYAQRVDSDGYTQWLLDGVAVCTEISFQGDPQITTDMNEGAIITWWDFRNGENDVFAQRIDQNGVAQWTVNGIEVCTATGDQTEPHITSDGSGGAIIAWRDGRNIPPEIYAQRIDADSNAVWAPDGVAVCTATGNQYEVRIVSDGAGGAIVSWVDTRTGSEHIYAQRINASGVNQWTADGVAVCTSSGYKYNSYMIPDGAGGAILTWSDTRDGDEDVYAQRISGSGVCQWTPDGIAVDDTDEYEYWLRATLTSDNDLILTWTHEGPVWQEVTNKVQRMNLDGQFLWGSGFTVCPTYGPKISMDLLSDGLGGAIVVWLDGRSMTHFEIYAQRFNENGLVQWGPTGVPVCALDNETEEGVLLVPDGLGGAIIAWPDNRTHDSFDIYALRLNRAGQYSEYYPAPQFSSIEDVPKDQGGRLSLLWLRSDADTMPNTEITHYSLWRLLPDAGASPFAFGEPRSIEELNITLDFDGVATRHLNSAQGDAWEWIENVPARHVETYARTVESLYDSLGTDPGWQYFVVTAHTNDPLVYFDSDIDSGYSVDNLSPAKPDGFAGIQSLAPQGLRLSWLPNGESDLSHYTVHRGDDEFFVPDVTNRVGTTADTVLIDTGWIPTDDYFYKMSAVDVHGNVGPDALLRPEDIEVGTLLQHFTAVLVGDCIEISWTLSEAEEGIEFFVLRADGAVGSFEELLSRDIESDGLAFKYIDRSVEPGETYRYRVEVEDRDGRRPLFETEPVETPAVALTLYQNHPNPFNPSTVIRYYLPEGGRVTLDIYDVTGKWIGRLVERDQERGTHAVQWNGRDGQGRQVNSGVYFYRLTSGKVTISKKMILLR